MKANWKRALCSLLLIITLSAVSASPVLSVSAQESIGNGLILSTDSITLTEGASTTFTAMLGEGFDASRLDCIVADPAVASITPAAYAANAAAFQVTYSGAGSTVAAIYHLDNPEVVAYITINATPLILEIPARLGINRDNYCTLISHEFVPYDFPYADFNDYKYTLNLRYQCASYKDNDFTKWGCYGYFYDAAGNVLSKVHLYCGSLAKGRIYHSEFNVPVEAVRFTIEGF
ncbi:MAG: hypothetical protein K2P63_14670 [Lachnospiraceae bacterium]|nr:hypothetical protein [Lachnospiraceae bacterium]